MVQGPQLAWCMLDPDGAIARASAATGLQDLRKLAEFRKEACLVAGKDYALVVGKGKHRPQASVIASVQQILEGARETMPTEASLVERGWWDAVVGVIRVTHHAQSGDESWALLGRWTQETKDWKTANIFDAEGSFALRAPFPNYWVTRPCSSFVRMNDAAVTTLRSEMRLRRLSAPDARHSPQMARTPSTPIRAVAQATA